MGMFDHIKCFKELPETEIMPTKETLFQTKDTPDQYLTIYTIDHEGYLKWKPYKMETVPLEERPYPDGEGVLQFCGMLRRVEEEEEIVKTFSGPLTFYSFETLGEKNFWWEYVAFFQEGKTSSISLVEFEIKKVKRKILKK